MKIFTMVGLMVVLTVLVKLESWAFGWSFEHAGVVVCIGSISAIGAWTGWREN